MKAKQHKLAYLKDSKQSDSLGLPDLRLICSSLCQHVHLCSFKLSHLLATKYAFCHRLLSKASVHSPLLKFSYHGTLLSNGQIFCLSNRRLCNLAQLYECSQIVTTCVDPTIAHHDNLSMQQYEHLRSQRLLLHWSAQNEEYLVLQKLSLSTVFISF